MNDQYKDPLVSKIANFLAEIGIPIRRAEVLDGAFLPGIFVEIGGLVIDEERLLYPGDLLHEAGHLAFAPATIRPTLSGEIKLPDVEPGVVEVQAMCWSYAACIHLGIEPEIVFHEHGYFGQSSRLLFSFRLGNYIGLPGLESAGMAYSPRMAAELGVEPFPSMIKWLLD